MDVERWEKLEVLLEEAGRLPPEQREEFLERACGPDAALRDELRSLLASGEAAPAFFSRLSGVLRPHPNREESLEDPYGMAGRTISRYRVLEVLGGGGMGVVYKAWDPALDRPVALKFLPPHLRADREARRRFVREAKAASALDHPNIAAVYEIGETEEEQLFIAMAFYEGETLKRKLDRGPLPVEACLDVAAQIARGLSKAHARGIIHRDLKPANIMITADGLVKIVDFGLAKVMGTRLTRTGATLGTLAYMAPEQVRGEEVDARSDLWSLGVLLYEMLAGRLPFRGDYEQAVAYAVLHEEPTPVPDLRPDVPAGLGQVIERLLRKEPEARCRDAATALMELERFRPGSAAALHRPAQAPGTTFPSRRWGAAAAAFLLALALALWLGLRERSETPTAAPVQSTAIAVLPFTVQGDEELQYLQSGMVQMLGSPLYDVGQLYSINANTLLSFLGSGTEGIRSPVRGREIAARFGAAYFVLGNVLKVGSRIQISATLYDAEGRELERAQATAPVEEKLFAAVDTLAQRLVAGQLEESGQQLASLATLTTSSWEALKVYLAGEQAFREVRFEAAVESFQHAVALDSTFALAWYRLAQTAAWLSEHALEASAIQEAFRHSEKLPQRPRELIQALHADIEGEAERAERLYRKILQKYPADLEAWRGLGEVLFHYNPLYGRPISEAWSPFARSFAYDPKNTGILLHLIDIAAQEQDHEAFDSLSAEFLARERGKYWYNNAFKIAQAFTWEDAELLKDQMERLRNARPETVVLVLRWVARTLQEIPTAQQLAEYLTAPDRPRIRQAEGHIWQAELALSRGRVAESETAYAEAAPDLHGDVLVRKALRYAPPIFSLSPTSAEAFRGAVAEWNPAQDSLSWWVHHADDDDEIKLFLQGLAHFELQEYDAVRVYASALMRLAASHEEERLPYSFAHTLQALLAWIERHPQEALEHLEKAHLHPTLVQAWYSPLYEQPLNRYLRAELLFEMGRYAEALRWYTSLTGGDYEEGLPYLGPSYLRRAEIYERLGREKEAAEFYARFVELWEEADPELQPMVEDARERLTHLKE